MRSMPAFRPSQTACSPPRRQWPLFALIFVLVMLVRMVYVSLFAASIPFWDQWDELDFQVLPWLQGSWHYLQLFQAHLEHRVAMTRLITMLLLAINEGVFDNLVEAYANAFIYAGLWVAVFALLTYGEYSRSRRWLLLLALVALSSLPFDWENALIGFQNCFYLMELAAVAIIAVATYCKPILTTVIGLTLLAGAGLFTMAPGLLAAPAVILVMGFRTRRDALPQKFIVLAFIAMSATTLAGLLLLHYATSPPAYGANGVFEFARAMLIALMWPLQPFNARFHLFYLLFAIVVWAPITIWMWRFARIGRAETGEIFAAGLCGWVLLELMAIAYARGHYMVELSSRYTEIPALGLTANFWLALKLTTRLDSRRLFAASVSIVFGMALVGWAFWSRFPADRAALLQRSQFSGIETANVRLYLTGAPMPTLPANSLELPYPSEDRLQHLLDMPQMRALFPPALLLPPESNKRAPLSALAAGTQRFLQHWLAWPNAKIAPPTLNAPARAVSGTSSAFRAYSGSIPDHPANAQCALDLINGQPARAVGALAHGVVALFQGWAGNGHGEALKQPILVLKSLRQSYAAPLTTGGERLDVAQALKSDGMAESGYNQSALLGPVASGTYSLLVIEAADPTTTCNLHQTLTVK